MTNMTDSNMIEHTRSVEFIYKDKMQCMAIGTTKITNGRQFIIGSELSRITLTLHQHFNWFQKLWWRVCFGVTIKDYSEE